MTEALEKVKNRETQVLLEEVISCYSNYNYRAAIVTLYTTLIFDLLNKIHVLSNYYDFEQAKKIMAEISNQKNKAPKSPQWEDTLLQGVKNINLVSNEEFEELQNLKTNRNYAAHPIVSLKSDNTIDYFEMKIISRETAADMIRKAFEIVFLKDPVIAINVNEKVENDIKNFYDTNGIIGLEEYLYTRYISKMTNKPKEMLFNFLWKMSFIKNDCVYKQAYVTAIITLCKSDESYFFKYLKNHAELFEKIEPENLTNMEEYKALKCKSGFEVDIITYKFKNNSRLVNLLYFLENLPSFKETLSDYIKSILYDESREILRNIFVSATIDFYNFSSKSVNRPEIEQIKLFAEHLYEVDDIEEHFNKINRVSGYIYGQSIFDKEMIERMYIQADYFGYKKELTKELIKNIARAGSYAEADDLLENISTLKKYFNAKDCDLLLKEIEQNSQFTDNRNYERIKSELQ